MNIKQYRRVADSRFAIGFVGCLVLMLGAHKASAKSHPQSAPAEKHVQAISGKPGNVFQASQPVIFKLSQVVGNTYDWRVTDWQGKTCLHGMIKAQGQPSLTISSLPLGYYKLWLKTKGAKAWQAPIPFARIVDLKSRHVNFSSPYCVDSAQSWLAAKGYIAPGMKKPNALQPPRTYRLVSNLEQLAGVNMLRDRISWTGIQSHPGVFRPGSYGINARLLAARHIHILDNLSDTPPWNKRGPNGIPNLEALYHFTRKLGQQFKGRITAWEFWNEVDQPAWHFSAWDFAAAQKVAYLGFHAGDPHATVLPSALALLGSPATMSMLNVMLRNGMGDYVDAFGFHTYLWPRQYPGQVSDLRGTLSRYGLADKPIWVTEVGLNQGVYGRKRPLLPGSGLWEHDASQARWQARRLVKAEVELHALGVARILFFVFPPYNEAHGHVVWGLFRWDWKVKPGYVALATLTAELANSRYLGPVKLGAEVHAYLFQQTANNKKSELVKPGKQTLVVWAKRRTTIVLPWAVSKVMRVNIMGRSTTLKKAADGHYHIVVGKAPIYLNRLTGCKPTSPAAHSASSASSQAQNHATKKNLKVVLRILLGHGFSRQGISHAVMADGQSASAVLDIYNFSQHKLEGTVQSLSQGCTVSGLSKQVTVPPMGHTQLPVTVKVAPAGHKQAAAKHRWLKLSGRFNGRVTDPVVVPLVVHHKKPGK